MPPVASKILAAVKAYALGIRAASPSLQPTIKDMPAYVYTVLAVGWALWFAAFPRKWNQRAVSRSDHRSHWGLLLQVIAYVLIWQGHFWLRHPALWRTVLSAVLFVLAALLSWTATTALGIHLRFEAAVSDGHELVRTGPYALVRHPIYASMLAVLLATGVIVTPGPLFFAALVIFIIGTEIRVRTEDNLLASHFGNEFQTYKQAVPAYIPLIR